MNFTKLKKDILVLDIETSSFFESGKEIDIYSDFETYVLMAQAKFFGAYSYKYNKFFNLEVSKNRQVIYDLLKSHKVLVGFNLADFDCRILENNGLIDENDYHIIVDCMTILGKSNFKSRDGFSYKNKGVLMGYNFKKNSLRHMAEVMEIDTQKGDIDYKIFNKDSWNELERSEIIKYLSADVKSNKEVFDKLWDYWFPFTDLLTDKNIKNLSWIRSSIASLIYKSCCHILDVEEDYAESPDRKIEEMGGRVIEPRVEEKEKVWYIDFASLYPHIMCMFNLFNETKDKTGWHGNDMFAVKGYYDISEQHKLSIAVQKKLKQRIELKKNDSENPLIYTLKIWCNGLYGSFRSPIFKNIHCPNGGWDTCEIAQTMHKYTEKRMKDFGFETIGGDTDGLMTYAVDEKNNNREYVKECLNTIVKEIIDNVPFPVDTFKIDIEEYLDYIMYPFEEQPIVEKEIRTALKGEGQAEGYAKEVVDKKKVILNSKGDVVKRGNKWTTHRVGKKKNYLYIYEKDGKKEVKILGLPIKKDNATKLGIKIYEEVLKEQIIKNNNAKFPKEYINEIIDEYVKRPDIMKLISIEYKIKPYKTYKIPEGKSEPTGIHAQISKHYFKEADGVINLIKNNKVGKVGKGSKYCSISEALEYELKREDLDLEKLENELAPFAEYKEEGIPVSRLFNKLRNDDKCVYYASRWDGCDGSSTFTDNDSEKENKI